MPGTLRSSASARVAVALAGLALLGVACAANQAPPAVPVQAGGRFVVQVVDSVNDAGRVPSLALGRDGNPSVAYLLLVAKLQKGQIPPPPVPGQPQPPAVVLASRSDSIWTRASVTKQGATPFGKLGGQAEGISFKDGMAGPTVHVGLAVDAQGKHHVAWSAATGLYYDDDVTGAFGDPQTVVGGQTYGAAVAVDTTGTPWISFYQGGLWVAHRVGTDWKVDDVAAGANPGGASAADTAIAVGSDGNPIVAYGDAGATKVARGSGGTWTAETIPGSGGYGVSMALDQKGNPHVGYYDSSGGVHVARSTGAGSWSVTSVGHVQASGGADSGWATGIGVDGNGGEAITFAGSSPREVLLASSRGGGFQSQVLPDSQGGADPSLAMTADGKTVAVAWYDTVNANLDLALPSSTGLALAYSPSPPPTAGPTTQAAACSPDGTTVQVVAPPGAAGAGFAEKCYAAPAGKGFTVDFQNNDSAVPHNFEIFTDSSAASRLGGAKDPSDIVTGPGKAAYQVSPLKAGTYYFQCDVHPTTMNGSFVVK